MLQYAWMRICTTGLNAEYSFKLIMTTEISIAVAKPKVAHFKMQILDFALNTDKDDQEQIYGAALNRSAFQTCGSFEVSGFSTLLMADGMGTSVQCE